MVIKPQSPVTAGWGSCISKEITLSGGKVAQPQIYPVPGVTRLQEQNDKLNYMRLSVSLIANKEAHQPPIFPNCIDGKKVSISKDSGILVMWPQSHDLSEISCPRLPVYVVKLNIMDNFNMLNNNYHNIWR